MTSTGSGLLAQTFQWQSAAQPVAPAALPLVAPVPVLETPEVAAARAEHLAAHAEAKAAVDAANAKEEEL